jgi:hypothetical protein
MTKPKLAALALSLLLGAGCSGLVACGSGSDKGLLPAGSADRLLAGLDRAEQLASEGRCTGAGLVAGRIVRQAQGLGADVDPNLKGAIVDGAQRLERLMQEPDGCQATETTTETTPTETTPTVTVTTKTVTQPPPTQTEPGSQGGGVVPTDQTPPDEQLPPEDQPNNGLGNGQDNNGGGVGPG